MRCLDGRERRRHVGRSSLLILRKKWQLRPREKSKHVRLQWKSLPITWRIGRNAWLTSKQARGRMLINLKPTCVIFSRKNRRVSERSLIVVDAFKRRWTKWVKSSALTIKRFLWSRRRNTLSSVSRRTSRRSYLTSTRRERTRTRPTSWHRHLPSKSMRRRCASRMMIVLISPTWIAGSSKLMLVIRHGLLSRLKGNRR